MNQKLNKNLKKGETQDMNLANPSKTGSSSRKDVPNTPTEKATETAMVETNSTNTPTKQETRPPPKSKPFSSYRKKPYRRLIQTGYTVQEAHVRAMEEEQVHFRHLEKQKERQKRSINFGA